MARLAGAGRVRAAHGRDRAVPAGLCHGERPALRPSGDLVRPSDPPRGGRTEHGGRGGRDGAARRELAVVGVVAVHLAHPGRDGAHRGRAGRRARRRARTPGPARRDRLLARVRGPPPARLRRPGRERSTDPCHENRPRPHGRSRRRPRPPGRRRRRWRSDRCGGRGRCGTPDGDGCRGVRRCGGSVAWSRRCGCG